MCILPRLACGPLEGRVSLAEEVVEVVVNAPAEAAKAAFFFLEEILGIIDQVVFTAIILIFKFYLIRFWLRCHRACRSTSTS